MNARYPNPREYAQDAVGVLGWLRDLYAVEARWVAGVSAADSDGGPVKSQDAMAVRWCLSGALRLARHLFGPDPVWEARNRLRHILLATTLATTKFGSFITLNDDGGYRAVVDLVDRAAGGERPVAGRRGR